MEPLTITTIAFMVFFIGFAVGRTSGGRRANPVYILAEDFSHEKLRRAESELYSERVRNSSLEQEKQYLIRSCRLHHYPPFHGNCCCFSVHEPKVYARSVDEQKLVDIITKGQKSAEQLAKDLGLKL